MTLATIITVEMHRHENSGAARLIWAFPAQSCNFIIAVDFVEFQHCKFDFSVFVLYPFGFGVRLLFTFFPTSIHARGYEYSGVLCQTTSLKIMFTFQGLATENKLRIL